MSNLTRVDYDTDAAFLQALVEQEFAWAKKQKRQIKYTDDFKMRVTVVGPGWQVARLPNTWSEREEMRELLAKTAYLAKALKNKAVMVASDARFTEAEAFIEHFKLPQIGPEYTGEQFRNDYHRILKEHGGLMQNLPRHVWGEVVMVGLKADPSCGVTGPIARFQPYTRQGAGIMWLPAEGPFSQDRNSRSEMGMIQDWWEIDDNDPNLARMKSYSELIFNLVELGLV